MQIGKHIASFDSLREMHDYMQLANTKDPTQRDAWFGGLSPKQRRQFFASHRNRQLLHSIKRHCARLRVAE